LRLLLVAQLEFPSILPEVLEIDVVEAFSFLLIQVLVLRGHVPSLSRESLQLFRDIPLGEGSPHVPEDLLLNEPVLSLLSDRIMSQEVYQINGFVVSMLVTERVEDFLDPTPTLWPLHIFS
jgi:hypothetical protein